MEGSVKDLSRYRFSCAKDNLEAAKVLLQVGQFKSSVNRSYYAIFHGLRAVTALDQFDSSKHSGVISYFNRTYVKEGVFDKSISKLVDTCYRLREKADYEDFAIVSREMAKEQLEKAEKILQMLDPYLEYKWETL
ncbi:MAG TPA: HEPN domain-containing protein [Candidatus Mediterraneibacter merdipullorum]|nr:HEPN domain-containing protein [Candidatus Mediterraneibacter merdipullorum]